MDTETADAMAWLLQAEEPSVRYLVHRDLLGEDSVSDRADVMAGTWVSALLAGQHEDGGFTRGGRRADPRASDAFDLLEKKRRPDGTVRAMTTFTRRPSA